MLGWIGMSLDFHLQKYMKTLSIKCHSIQYCMTNDYLNNQVKENMWLEIS